MPFTSLPELSPAFSIRAGSGLGPGWVQVVRLVASFYQPLLIEGHIQAILVLHLTGPRGLRHRGTIVPSGVHRPCLVTEIPWRMNGNQGRWRRVMGDRSRRQGSPIQSRGRWSLSGRTPKGQIHRAGAYRPTSVTTRVGEPRDRKPTLE